MTSDCGKSTSSSSDDGLSLPSSKLACDDESLSSDIIDDHPTTTILEGKCDGENVIDDGCLDEHEILNDDTAKVHKFHDSISDHDESKQDANYDYQQYDDPNDDSDEGCLRLIGSTFSRFDRNNAVPLNDRVCTLVLETQKFASFEIHNVIMYCGEFGIAFGDYVEHLGLFYCATTPNTAILTEDDILMHFLSMDFQKVNTLSVCKYLQVSAVRQPNKTLKEVT